MNVAGLSNLGLKATAQPASQGKSASGKEATSFESLLGKTQTAKASPVKARPEEKPAQREKEQGPSTEKNNAQTPVTARAEKSSESQTSKPVAPEGKPGQETSEKTQAVGPADQAVAQEKDLGAQDVGPSSLAVGVPGFNDRPVVSQTTSAAINQVARPAMSMGEEDPTNSLSRRVVWNDFLRKMNDLGVSADDVLQAFSSLTKEELAQPPEKSVDKLVMALGLDGQQASLAKQYFNELMARTKAKSMGEELAASKKQVGLTLVAQRDLQHKAVAHSLDGMNRDFFMDRPLQRERALDVEQMPAEGGEIKAEAGAATAAENIFDPARTADVEGPQARTKVPNTNPHAAEMNKLVGQMKAPLEKKSVDDLIRDFNLQTPPAAAATGKAAAQQSALMNGMPMPVAVTTQASEGPTVGKSPAHTAPSMSGPSVGGPAGFFIKQNSRENTGEESRDDSRQASLMNGAALSEGRQAAGTAKGEFQGHLAQAMPQQGMMTVPDAVQQAHILVRDGGGDMKVTLHPDGLGEVAMRVSVDNGKVNVQMITESDEAKKLIERQIGDLKSGLTANHLQVESIKVDTATNLGRQLEQQYHDAQRQQTQASMEQFRQDHQGWRRSFFETGSVNPYLSQGEGPRVAPTPTSDNKAASNRRLDLVA